MHKNVKEIQEANARKREIGKRLNELADKLAGPDELTQEQREQITGEQKSLRSELDVLNMRTAALVADMAVEERGVSSKADKNAFLRELLLSKDSEGVRQKREISLSVLTDNAKNNIRSAGAVALDVKDLLPDLDEGLIWGLVGLQVQTNVKGDILWPYATSVVNIEEVGEAVALTDQGINFDKIEVSPKRLGATIAITNEALDDSTFDLLSYVQKAITLAVQRHLNWKTFSFDRSLTGLKGPFASAAANPTAIVATYKNLLEKKALIVNAGVDMTGFAWVMDAQTEALLKATPKAPGQGGFIIQDGKLDGDPYFVTHYIRQNANGDADNKMYIGLGVWSNLAANQHGDVKLVIDPFTKATKGETVVTLNTRWSLTTLRPQAFAVYEIQAAPTMIPGIELDIHSASLVKGGSTLQLSAATYPEDAEITWTTSASGKATVSNGLVTTGSTAGDVEITASISYMGKTISDTCVITVTNS